MTMVGSGLEGGQSTERKSKLVVASLVSLVLGLLVFASGVIAEWVAYDQMLAAHGSATTDLYVWSYRIQDVGFALAMLGLVFYVAGKRKGV